VDSGAIRIKRKAPARSRGQYKVSQSVGGAAFRPGRKSHRRPPGRDGNDGPRAYSGATAATAILHGLARRTAPQTQPPRTRSRAKPLGGRRKTPTEAGASCYRLSKTVGKAARASRWCWRCTARPARSRCQRERSLRQPGAHEQTS